MKSLCFTILYIFLFGPLHAPAQEGIWEKWDPEVVQDLYTSRDVPYLTAEEQKVILFMNMARYNGPLFDETFLESYLKENRVEITSYVRSLRRELARTSGLPPLVPEKDLTAVAQGHAVRSGETGHVGHRDMEKRFAPLRGNPYTAWGENCSYGYEDAISIVMTLLIDEGIRDAGHRKNILNPVYNSVGVAIRPHKRYRVNCVIDFGKQDRSGLNEVPY